VLVAVVGPSGAGKDTLMHGARDALAGDARFVFARRAITRPAAAGGEDHEALTPEAFRERRDAGGFALHWEAHGLLYGIPAGIGAELAAGRVVVANLSRAILPEAASRFPLLVVHVTATAAVLAARLAARGREDAADIAARLAREAALPPGIATRRVINDGSVAEGVAQLVAILRQVSAETAGASASASV
jgi:phosphonate metabolism protein PhnN/1,5-bisphosphokinase (PRPP-forming)